jgi:hypothetical protein
MFRRASQATPYLLHVVLKPSQAFSFFFLEGECLLSSSGTIAISLTAPWPTQSVHHGVDVESPQDLSR